MAYAIVSTVNPNARATPTKPIPRFGNAAASTALPHPPRTNQNVPMNSATVFFPITFLPSLAMHVRPTTASQPTRLFQTTASAAVISALVSLSKRADLVVSPWM